MSQKIALFVLDFPEVRARMRAVYQSELMDRTATETVIMLCLAHARQRIEQAAGIAKAMEVRYEVGGPERGALKPTQSPVNAFY